MTQKKQQRTEMNPDYNETTAVVVEYLEMLCRSENETPASGQGNIQQKGIDFNGFGTEHASFLLKGKE